MKTDPQQKKAYDWEDGFTAWAGEHIDAERAERIIVAACNKYRVPVPELRFPRNNRRLRKTLSSQYDPNDHSITLRPRHMNAALALHESAHAITDWILGYTLDAHGPEWLGVYMVLLEDFGISTRESLHASADAAGLKYRTRAFVSPRNIRKRNRRRAVKAALARAT